MDGTDGTDGTDGMEGTDGTDGMDGMVIIGRMWSKSTSGANKVDMSINMGDHIILLVHLL